MATVTRPMRGARVLPNAVLILAALFFVLPLAAMARFGFQRVPTILLGASTLFKKWSFDGITKAFKNPEFTSTLWLSLRLAAGTAIGTLALLLPTAVWVHLKLPKARPLIEFFTVLPYMVPGIALVAGIKVIKPHARWFLDSPWSLIPFYIVLALPFTYRSIDAGIKAIDLRTLVDASRSLGAGWGTTLRRVLIPNLRTSLISSTFLTVAVVLGEFTIASLLLRKTLPTFLATYRGQEPQGAYALSVFILVATTLLFVVLNLLTRRRGAKARLSDRASVSHTVSPPSGLPA